MSPREPTRELARLRLLQLCSPALPIGAFAYSQGLEQATELGWVKDRMSLQRWLAGVLSGPVARTDLPLLARALRGFLPTPSREAAGAAFTWCARVHSLRETKELRDEERHLGSALARVLVRLGVPGAELFVGHALASYVVSFALAAAAFGVEERAALEGFSFAWLENQIAAATRLMPLGQLDAQELLSELMRAIPDLAERASQLPEDELGFTAPAFALASSWHEGQYSRLFRS